MSSVLVSGTISGFLYALMGAGLVILYRQSRVLNFAHGAVATLAAYVAYELMQSGAPYWLAALTAVVVGVVTSAVIDLLVIRRLTAASDFTVAVATLGVGLLIIGVITYRWGSIPVPMRPPIQTDWTVNILGLEVGATQMLSIVITLAVFGCLFVLIERTRFGLAMRAASEGPVTAGMLGINVPLIRAGSWALAGGLAAIAALLITPQYYLSPHFLTAFMITAFAAIVLGGLESIGGALVGGLLFGIGSSILSFYVTSRLTQTVAFLMILVVLAFRPQGLFGKRLHQVTEPVIVGRRAASRLARPRSTTFGPSPWFARLRQGLSTAVVGSFLVLAFLVPWIVSDASVFEYALVAAILPAVLGQNVIGGYGGQASIGQSGFMVVGAYTTALLVQDTGLPFELVLLISTAVSALTGVVLALGAARLSGVYLALLTLAFALALPELAAFPEETTGGANGIAFVPQEIVGVKLTGATNQYLFVLITSLVLAGAMALLAGSAPGRAWRAVRDSEIGAASVGISVARVRVTVVGLGGGLAGLAGSLTLVLVGYLSPESFTLWTAIYLLAAVIIGGSSSVVGCILGAAFITLLPFHTQGIPELTEIIFGAAIVGVILFAPRGLAYLIALPKRERGARKRDAQLVAGVSDVSG